MTAIDPGRPATPVVPDLAQTLGRIATVRVNLLPQEVTLARRGHKVRRIAIAAVVLLVVVLAAVSFVARAGVGAAQSDLGAADSLTASLRSQQARYADVVALQEQVRAAVEQLDQVTAGDLGWAPVLTAVRAAAPAGLTVDEISAAEDSGAAGSVGGAPGGTGTTPGDGSTPARGTGTAAAAPVDPAAVARVATLTVIGTAVDPTVVAAYVDALSTITALSGVVATGVAELPDGTGYTYGVTAVVTSAAALPTLTPSGGK